MVGQSLAEDVLLKADDNLGGTYGIHCLGRTVDTDCSAIFDL